MPWHLRYSLRLIFHVIEYERAIKKRVYGNYPIMNRFHDEAKKKKGFISVDSRTGQLHSSCLSSQ